ncbi:sulfite exporter TauE/SafE family protein [Haematospirillum jordaniae]|nr:sulfite exporter TauE/SafE family protein [Haematospirillum jordaniae]
MAWTNTVSTDTTLSILILAAGFIGTGIAAGFLAGLLGVGGGIIMVPALFHLLATPGIDDSVRMHMAVGTSLAVIIPTALSSSWSHHRRHAIDTDLLKTWAPGIVAGSVLAGIIAASVKGYVLTAVFSVTALLVALHMAFGPSGSSFTSRMPGTLGQLCLGTLIGTLATLMGIGGATLSVPAMTAFSIPIHRAVATASALGLAIGIPGAVGFAMAGTDTPGRPPWSLGYISLPGALVLAPLSACFAPWGARVSHTVKPHRLRQVFALFLFVTSLRMLWNLQS